MGLDLHLLQRATGDDAHARWSYGGFNRFRERLCETAGLGNLRAYHGFGGKQEWPSPDVQPLVPLLNHSDCEGQLWGWEVIGLANALRAVVRLWPEDDYDRQMGERLASMFEAAERDSGLVVFE